MVKCLIGGILVVCSVFLHSGHCFLSDLVYIPIAKYLVSLIIGEFWPAVEVVNQTDFFQLSDAQICGYVCIIRFDDERKRKGDVVQPRIKYIRLVEVSMSIDNSSAP